MRMNKLSVVNKFAKHSRSKSIVHDDQVPVKEVWMYDIKHDTYISNDIWENKLPSENNEDQVLTESENINRCNMPIIKFKPSSKFIDCDQQDCNKISIKLNQRQSTEQEKSINKEKLFNENIDINYTRKNSPSMIEMNKFNTFNDLSIHKTTFIGDSKWRLLKTRNQKNYEIISKFNTHKSSIDKEVINKKRAEFFEKSEDKKNKNNKQLAYNYNMKSMKSFDLIKSQTIDSYKDYLIVNNDNIYNNKNSENKHNNVNIHSSRIPKTSKPTKTIKMNISQDESRNGKLSDNSLRYSKDSISFRGSIASK